MRVLSLGWEDPLEEGMETHSSILAWRIPWTEEPGGLQRTGSQRVGYDWSELACTHLEVTIFFFNSKGYCEITYHYESEGISSRTGHPALAHAMEPLRCSQTSYRGCGYLGRFPREGYASSRTWRTTMQRPPWQRQKMNECEFQPSVINMEGFGGSQYRVLMRK